MKSLKKHFLRYNGGGWLCIKDIDIDGPQGRVKITGGAVFMPGSEYMNMDVARWLDDQTAKGPADQDASTAGT